jgi:hypothetical protein
MELNLKSTDTKVQQISILTKDSTENEIKAYFQKVLELKQSGEEFPVNLELVWPLVYGRKEEATRALKADFIEGVDFQVLRKNAKNPSGGRPVEDYHLSVPCMEYFIARKVRSIFDVYHVQKLSERGIYSSLDLLQVKKLLFFSKNFGGMKKNRIFAVLQSFINYALGIFYTHLASVNNILVRVSVSYFAAEQIRGCSRLGNFSPFLFIK